MIIHYFVSNLPKQIFKIMNKMDKCSRYNRFKIILNQVRGPCSKYFKEISRQLYRENFFCNRILNILNSLPSEIVEAKSVNNFKAGNTLTGLASTA